ncbi:MAG TPA: FAD-dependent oxidoreductase [Chloroflexia bacterium]|nr:FAD-dependent oxidoreductase [Chloroflexia bacterium]
MTNHFPTVIIGAGPTGLSAAYHTAGEYLLLDKNDRVGGACRSAQRDGFIFDYPGDITLTTEPYARQLTASLLDDNMHFQPRQAWIYSNAGYSPYPFRANTHDLPEEVARECMLGLLEAHQRWPDGARGAANLEEFIYRHLGAGIAKQFMIPYNSKVWTVPLTMMTHDWTGSPMPISEFEYVIDGALGMDHEEHMGLRPTSRFFYPLRGGMQALMDAFLPQIREPRVNSRVTNIDVARRAVTVNGQEEVGYDRLITTIPLPELAKLVPEMPRNVREAIGGLINVPVYCIHLGVDRPKITDKHWIYYPESEFVMQRIFVQSNASPFTRPEGTSSLTLEISYSPYKPVSPDGLIERGIADTIKAGLLKPEDRILVAELRSRDYAYVVYTHERPRQVALALDWLHQHDIYPAGRFATWEYLNFEGTLLAGKTVAAQANATARTPVGRMTVPTVPVVPNRQPPGSVRGTDGPTSDQRGAPDADHLHR